MTVTTPCLLSNLIVDTDDGRLAYRGGIDCYGVESNTNLFMESKGQHKREYTCKNCGVCFDGQESFDAVQNHLGGFYSREITYDPFVRLDNKHKL